MIRQCLEIVILMASMLKVTIFWEFAQLITNNKSLGFNALTRGQPTIGFFHFLKILSQTACFYYSPRHGFDRVYNYFF